MGIRLMICCVVLIVTVCLFFAAAGAVGERMLRYGRMHGLIGGKCGDIKPKDGDTEEGENADERRK